MSWPKTTVFTVMLTVVYGLALSVPMAHASPDTVDASSIKLRPPMLSTSRDFDDFWYAGLSRLRAGDYATAQVHIEQLLTTQREYGPRNLFRISDEVAGAAIQAASQGNLEEAKRLISLARRLAPESARSSLASAQANYLAGEFAMGEIVRDLADSAWSLRTDLSELINVRTRLSVAGMLAILLCLTLFGGFMLIRHGPRLVHNVAHVVPAAMRGPPVVVLAISGLVLAPIALGFGLVPLALCWLLALAPYLSWSERLVGLALAIGVAFLPGLNHHYARGLAHPLSVSSAAYQCAYGRCSEASRSRLEAVTPEQSDYAYAQMALGLSRMNKGAAPRANSYILQGVVNHMQASLKHEPNNYAALVGLANSQYLMEMRQCRLEQREPRLDPIVAQYKQAAMHSEAGPEAAFNMSGLQTQLGNIVVATEYMDIALAKNSAAVKHQQRLISGPIPGLCPKEFGGNYRLMQARPAAMMLWSLSEADSEVNPSLLVPFSPLWVGVFSLATIGILATVIGSTLVFFGLFMSFWAPAHRCEKCAEVACRRCRPELKYLQVCERCLLVSVQGQLVDSRDQWLQQRRIKRRQKRRTRYVRIISLLVPGGAQFLTGRALSGAAYLAVVSLLGLILVAGSTLVPGVGWDALTPPLVAIASTVCGLVYMAAQIDTWVST